jgi:anti-sigma B factor antagonist
VDFVLVFLPKSLRRLAIGRSLSRPYFFYFVELVVSECEYNLWMPLSASIENLPEGIALVRLSGGLTLGTSLKIADSQIQSAIEGGVTRMVIDLTHVEYVDSAGLGALMYAYGMLNEKGGALRLCGVNDRVLSLLQMTKTHKFLPIDKSQDESLAALRG